MKAIHKTINGRARYEQEQAILFSGLYPEKEKCKTKNELGERKQFERKLKQGKFNPL